MGLQEKENCVQLRIRCEASGQDATRCSNPVRRFTVSYQYVKIICSNLRATTPASLADGSGGSQDQRAEMSGDEIHPPYF